MHRSYQSVLPTHNKLLQQRWDSTYYREHQKKISEAKPMVNTKPPQTYMHLHLKLKKLQLEEERLATIERDNRILLEKMSFVMRTQGRVDNRNGYEYKSMNREKRMRELLRVTQENQDILRRITARKPELNHEKWQAEWNENQRFMDQISHYPRGWWQKDGSQSPRRERSTVGSKSSSRRSTARSEKSQQRRESRQEDQPEKQEQKQEKKQEKNKQEKKQEQKQEKAEEKEQDDSDRQSDRD